MATTDSNARVLEDFERILADRVGAGPSGKNYDPELLFVGSQLIEEVKQLRAALARYASRGEWAQGDTGTCHVGRRLAAKALGRE